jgi:hypothetical protein
MGPSPPPALGEHVCAVHGHFPASRFAALRPRFTFTFLREPIDNLVSIYFYWQTLAPADHRLHRRFHAERPSLTAFARYPGIGAMIGCYFDQGGLESLDFVGFYERRSADLARLSALTGIAFDAARHANPTNPLFAAERAALKHDRLQMDDLREILAGDIAAYDAAFANLTGAAGARAC